MNLKINTLFLLCCSVYAVYAQAPGKDEQYKKIKAQSEKITASAIKELEINSKKEYSELLKHFDLKKVEGTKAGWYHHKNKISKMQSRIEAPVSVSGHIYLKAFLVSDTVYNATRIRVKINNWTLESNPLAEGGSYIQRKFVGKKWREALNHFSYRTSGDYEVRAINIIAAIAATKPGEKVKLEFIGPKDNYEVHLSDENIKAIKDSWKLSQYILINSKNYFTYTQLIPFMTPVLLMPNVALTKDDMKGVNYD